MFQFNKKLILQILTLLTVKLKSIYWIDVTGTWNRSRVLLCSWKIKIMTHMISKIHPNRKVCYLRNWYKLTLNTDWTFSARLLNLEINLKLVQTARSVMVIINFISFFEVYFYINFYNYKKSINVQYFSINVPYSTVCSKAFIMNLPVQTSIKPYINQCSA